MWESDVTLIKGKLMDENNESVRKCMLITFHVDERSNADTLFIWISSCL